MDPVSTAIILAITSGLAAGASAVTETALVDIYNGIKTLISNKYGPKNSAIKAINEYEKKPESQGRRDVLIEEITDVKANQDPEIIELANKLIEKLDKPGAQTNIQKAIGKNIAIASNQSTASVNTSQKDNDDLN